MPNSIQIKDIFSGFLAFLFILIGILNMIYIHVIPGLFYMVIALFYFPPFVSWVRQGFSVTIPYFIRIIIAFLILWATLAVGDLVEYFESILHH